MGEDEGNCLKYLKRGVEQKRGEGKQDFKKRGKLGQGVGTLKRREGWAGTLLQAVFMESLKTFERLERS